MIIPANEILFQNDGRPFKEKMIRYIKHHWEEVLGEDTKLLNLPNGLDLVAEKYSLSPYSNRKTG